MDDGTQMESNRRLLCKFIDESFTQNMWLYFVLSAIMDDEKRKDALEMHVGTWIT